MKWRLFIIILLSLIVAYFMHVEREITLLFPALLSIILIIAIFDSLSNHNILRNYPFLGRFRYIFEFIRPEIQQYFVATNLSGRPYNRELRSLVYQRAKNVNDNHPFGTEHDIDSENYHFAYHSLNVKHEVATVESQQNTVAIGSGNQSYFCSRLNISAMSYGALSSHAIKALNRGAKAAQCYHNTGEGGVSKYHLSEGGDLVWQIGTAYFGCRTEKGLFCPELFSKMASKKQIKMIEIKLSQGAKPSHGGILPKKKITAEIAAIRHISTKQDCISPPTHSAFHTPTELCYFIQKLRELSHHKPIGFKFCVGKPKQFFSICKAMLATDIYPDFITVDGAEGGTGAAPVEFTNRLGMPLEFGLNFVHNALIGCGIRDKIKIIASAKIVTGFDMITVMALGADICNMARPMMFALGCIQSLKCHTNHCPTGVATTDAHRTKALVVKTKAHRIANFQHKTLQSFHSLLDAMGYASPSDISPKDIFRRTNDGKSISLYDYHQFITEGCLLKNNIPKHLEQQWQQADAELF